MALFDSELQRIKFEIGYNVLTFGAEPFVNVVALFEQVIQPYVSSEDATTSATTVTAASDPNNPSPVTIVVASATGISAGVRLVVDVDKRLEVATVQSISGSSVTLQLAKAHSGTYPVSVESGETVIRGLLRQIVDLDENLQSKLQAAGLKKVDEIEFFAGDSARKESILAKEFLRDELASALGVPNLRRQRMTGGSRLEMY